MAELDQTVREAVRLWPADFQALLLPNLDPDLKFSSWLDTELRARGATRAKPGKPRRRCDTIAGFESVSGKAPPCAVIIEAEARVRAGVAGRMLEYLVRAWRTLRHGPHRKDTFEVGVVVIFLKGKTKSLRLRMSIPGTTIRLKWNAQTVCLQEYLAADLMDRVQRGELRSGVLVWIPLTQGGCNKELVERWVQLVAQEPDEEKRADLAQLARVFAEWVGGFEAWNSPLEGLTVWKSKYLEDKRTESRNEGRVEGERRKLLQALELRFPGQSVDDLKSLIGQTVEVDYFDRWFEAVLKMVTLEEVRQAILADLPPTRN